MYTMFLQSIMGVRSERTVSKSMKEKYERINSLSEIVTVILS